MSINCSAIWRIWANPGPRSGGRSILRMDPAAGRHDAAPPADSAGIRPEKAFGDPADRQLRFRTNRRDIEIIRVRSFDVATFVAFGAAALGVVGSDVLMEFDYPEVYAPVDLKVGRCRLAVAEPAQLSRDDDPSRWSHIRIASKYPEISRRHFA